jgi:hypothetical protein
MNGGLPPSAPQPPPQAHSSAHTVHLSHPMYSNHTPHHLLGSTSSSLAATVPNALTATTVPQSASPSQPSTASASVGSVAPASYTTPPQVCPLQLSVTAPQPPVAHSATTYVPPYASQSHPLPSAASHLPYSTHSQTPPALPPPISSQSAYPPLHASAHLPPPHALPNSHPPPHHVTHPPQQQPPPSSHAVHATQPSSASHVSSVAYNHVSHQQIPSAYSSLPYSRSAVSSSVTSDNSTVVVAAPSVFPSAVPPHSSATSSFPSLYAPYSSTPYLPSSHSVSTYYNIVWRSARL